MSSKFQVGQEVWVAHFQSTTNPEFEITKTIVKSAKLSARISREGWYYETEDTGHWTFHEENLDTDLAELQRRVIEWQLRDD